MASVIRQGFCKWRQPVMSVILRQLSCVTQFHAGNGRTYLLPVSSCKILQNNCRSLSMTDCTLKVDRNEKPDISSSRTPQTADHVLHQITQKLDETQQFSLDKENLLVFWQSLLDLRCPSEDIVQMFLNSDKILKMTVETWNKTLWFYETLGFRKRNLLMMIDAIPVLSKQQQRVIPEIINTLRMHDFGEGQCQHVVAENPSIVLLQPRAISYRVENLKAYFTSKECCRIISKAPSVLTDDWESIVKKCSYVHYEMGLRTSKIAKTDILLHDLNHLRARHLFLHRAALYEKPNKHGETSKIRNHNLSTIIDTPDEVFAKSIARMPLKDYRTFYKMIEQEEEWKEEEEERFSDGEEELL